MRSWQMDVERDHTKRLIRRFLEKYPSRTIEELVDIYGETEEEIRIILKMIADEDKAAGLQKESAKTEGGAEE